jgi:hypothetical protein
MKRSRSTFRRKPELELLFNFDSNVNTNPATKYTSEDRNNGSIVDTIGFAIVETEPKNAAERIAAT